MNKTTIRVIYLAVILFIIGMWYYGAKIIQDHQPRPSGLGYYSQDTFHAEEYQVRDFEMNNQYHEKINRRIFENKIWVADFFFTTCEGICPIMSSNLTIVQDSFRSDTNVLILSHTVDPDYDTEAILKSYADRHGAIQDKWHFVTGDKATIYDLARTSYFSATPKDTSYGEDFVHSQLIALIDPHLHIRGYYDGTNQRDIYKLIRDIRRLEAEYDMDGRPHVKNIFSDLF